MVFIVFPHHHHRLAGISTIRSTEVVSVGTGVGVAAVEGDGDSNSSNSTSKVTGSEMLAGEDEDGGEAEGVSRVSRQTDSGVRHRDGTSKYKYGVLLRYVAL